jgi:hypothetical protein
VIPNTSFNLHVGLSFPAIKCLILLPISYFEFSMSSSSIKLNCQLFCALKTFRRFGNLRKILLHNISQPTRDFGQFGAVNKVGGVFFGVGDVEPELVEFFCCEGEGRGFLLNS